MSAPDTTIPPMGQPLLTVEDLRVSYPAREGRFMAVNGVSFTLTPGETFGLVGESGSGKTTTAMALLRLLKPPAQVEGGRVLMDGLDLFALPPRELSETRWRKLALIPQGAMNSLNPVMRIQDQIEDVIIVHESLGRRRSLRNRVVKLLHTVDLPEHVCDMYPHELSGGMKQRVCIAMAIALEPKVIIADEPTSALDVVVQRVVAETLRDVQQRLNLALVLIGHDMGLQAQMVDRLGIMYAGKLVEVGPVRSIFKQAQHPYTQRLIASIPSIKHQARPTPGMVGTWKDLAADDIPPLRLIAPGHFAALP